MKLDGFLKVKKMRCVSIGSYTSITAGKEYDVAGVYIVNDDGRECFYSYNHFEPVLESAEKPLQEMKLTPKFKVGDKVYVGLTGRVAKATEIIDDEVVSVTNENNEVRVWTTNICYATQENYEMLSKLYPHIEFEQPPTQEYIDNEAVDKLAQAMKNKLAKKREQGYKGWETCKHGDLVQLLINHVDKGDPIDVANFCAFLFARGEPLTQSVLDE